MTCVSLVEVTHRFLDLAGDGSLVAVPRASADLAFALLRRVAIERPVEGWTEECDAAVSDFLRDWDQGVVSVRLRAALGAAARRALVEAARVEAASGGEWTRDEHQVWLADLCDGEAVTTVDLAVGDETLALLASWLRDERE